MSEGQAGIKGAEGGEGAPLIGFDEASGGRGQKGSAS